MNKFSRPLSLLIFCLIFGPTAVHAQDQSEKAALALIVETANQICQSVPISGEGSNLTLSGNADVQLNGLLKKALGAGITMAAQYQHEGFNGVLHKDLADAIQNGDDCRRDVFHTLADKLIPNINAPAPPINPGPAPTPNPNPNPQPIVHLLNVCPTTMDSGSYFAIIVEGQESEGWFQENRCYDFPVNANVTTYARVFLTDVGLWNGQYGLLDQTGPKAWGPVCATGPGGQLGELDQLFSWRGAGSCQAGPTPVQIPFTQVVIAPGRSTGQNERFRVTWKS